MGGCLASNVGQCNENRVKYFTLYVSQEGVVFGVGQGWKRFLLWLQVWDWELREGLPGHFGWKFIPRKAQTDDFTVDEGMFGSFTFIQKGLEKCIIGMI